MCGAPPVRGGACVENDMTDQLGPSLDSNSVSSNEATAAEPGADASADVAAVQLAQAPVTVIAAPAAGERIVESVQPGERIQLGFDLDETVQREADGTVEIELPNGGVVVLEGLTDAAFSGAPVEITNADGTVINLADFLVALGVSPEAIETAAGPAAG